MSFATRAPGGFSPAAAAGLEQGARLISPYAERIVLRRIAVDLLAAYLGPSAGFRVWDGRIERGDVETIDAAMLFCDLRDFTALSGRHPRSEVIAIVNRWFDVLGEAIEAHDGDILNFMGDGLLAVFPVSDGPSATCERALTAARAIVASTAKLNVELAAEGRPVLRFGAALHLGAVEFGNVGTRHRLDFTVVGPAVNEASRLEGLTKTVGRNLVVSSACAAATGRPLRPLGSFELRGVDQPATVYAPDG